MRTERFIRWVYIWAAVGVLWQVNACSVGNNFGYDVTVQAATGLATVGIMTFLNNVVAALFPVPPA